MKKDRERERENMLKRKYNGKEKIKQKWIRELAKQQEWMKMLWKNNERKKICKKKWFKKTNKRINVYLEEKCKNKRITEKR